MATKTIRQGSRSKRGSERYNRLLLNDVPRWIRVYDNGGKTADRYTCVFSGLGIGGGVVERGLIRYWPLLFMSSAPYYPQGVGMHEEATRVPDYPSYSHFGRKIVYADLPLDCQYLVLNDYADYWHIDLSGHPLITRVVVGSWGISWWDETDTWLAPRPPKGKFDSRIAWRERERAELF